MNMSSARDTFCKLFNASIDFHVPQSWFDLMLDQRIMINPRDYVWCYMEGRSGPLHKHTMLVANMTGEKPILPWLRGCSE